MNHIDLDNISIPQLHSDGMRPNQFKTFYSLHSSTLFQPVLSLNTKLSSLCFTADALYSIQDEVSKVFDGKFQRLLYVMEYLDRDVFSTGELCETAKRRNSTILHLSDFEVEDVEEHSDAATLENVTSSSVRHSSKFSFNSSKLKSDSEPRKSGKTHQGLSTHDYNSPPASGEFMRSIKGGLRSMLSRGISRISDTSAC
jgi:hypothetical protein